MQLRPILIFLSRKLVRLALLLLAVAVMTFVLLSLSPIDPVQAYIGADMLQISPEQRELIAQRWGLDQPMLGRFGDWLGQLVQGNWGTSMVFNQPVAQVINQRFQVSLQLLAIAWLISGLLGLGLGVLAGAFEGTWIDRGIRLYAYTLASSPTFWVALLLLIFFSVSLRVTPICCAAPPGVLSQNVTFWQHLHHLLLPAITLSIIGVANIALHTRQKLIEVLSSDYVLFARAQGETLGGILKHHGLRNILLPALTLQFASLSELFGGSVLVEQVFAYPGLGEATVQAALRSDVPLLVGIVFFSALFVYSGNTLADLAYQVIDPRIRLGGRGAA
ncbi:ABC transporter permease [Pseudanabaena sp. FACHB-2040]|uniref:ABC transporter permease n=1 Tax=Pseudanabaena sp. FACHB-2040 TaxID=2692859 RepID=UPI00168936E1|nr:ABC transporter permease [Pseudanabaena sp. FACHB-2040]MBD0267324.1 ABC transporter permease [Cyanobacteria bacterium Co-bin8]MBD2256888.1 ABC transporter permease [Pseudanabaena sp. FACHB-2040]